MRTLPLSPETVTWAAGKIYRMSRENGKDLKLVTGIETNLRTLIPLTARQHKVDLHLTWKEVPWEFLQVTILIRQYCKSVHLKVVQIINSATFTGCMRNI